MITKLSLDFIANLYSDPTTILDVQKDYAHKMIDLADYAIRKLNGQEVNQVFSRDKDHRFGHPLWKTNLCYDLLKQHYLMYVEYIIDTIKAVPRLDHKTRERLLFFSKFLLDAIAPTNFPYTNPEVMEETIKTQGHNLIQGLQNLISDLEKSSSLFYISRTKDSAFQVGSNIACTPGTVILKNEIMELIYYTPTKQQVHEIPLLIIPPWINKFYILDLSPHNSMVKWLLEQGISVFLISWINPDDNHHDFTFDDYLRAGALTALNFITTQLSHPKVNILGYCIGGTLTTILLAYLTKNKQEQRVNSATLLTTLVDFKKVGDMSVFIDENLIEQLDETTEALGYFDGKNMSMVFNMLRANDMIWYFITNNYLLGKDPGAFDILFWNSDSTRLPSKMHLFYLRNMYLKNNLVKPNKMSVCNTPIDITKITTPCFIISTKEDHIAPWQTTYETCHFLKGENTFVLSSSGHVGGIVNHPNKNKYCYWTNADLDVSAFNWLRNAEMHQGSWWSTWQEWLTTRSGKLIAPIEPQTIAKYKLENAPGSYVKMK